MAGHQGLVGQGAEQLCPIPWHGLRCIESLQTAEGPVRSQTEQVESSCKRPGAQQAECDALDERVARPHGWPQAAYRYTPAPLGDHLEQGLTNRGQEVDVLMGIDKVWPSPGLVLKGGPLRVNLCGERLAP